MKITIEAESLTDERLMPILKAASEMGRLVLVVCEIEPRAVQRHGLFDVDWSDAPATAKYHAFDADDCCGHWYSDIPQVIFDGGSVFSSFNHVAPSGFILPFSLRAQFCDSVTPRPAVPCSRSES